MPTHLIDCIFSASIINVVVGAEVVVELIVVDAIVIFLRCTLSVSYSVDMASDVTFDLFTDALVSVMLRILSGIAIELLTNVNANAFAVVATASEFPQSAPLEKCSP